MNKWNGLIPEYVHWEGGSAAPRAVAGARGRPEEGVDPWPAQPASTFARQDAQDRVSGRNLQPGLGGLALLRNKGSWNSAIIIAIPH